MTLLVQFAEHAPETIVQRTGDPARIASALSAIGVGFERWAAHRTLAPGSSSQDILQAYAADIERLQRTRGYRSADVVRLARDASDAAAWAEKARAARGKFLDEHTHGEDEVRFFVEGAGAFYLHAAGNVTAVLCERDDLLSVPAGMRHWFDMGADPAFCAIRLFGSEAGWVASFTGDKLSARFPSFDALRALG